MRAALIIVGALVVLLIAGFVALLVYAETIRPDEGEVRIELEDTFPE